MEGHVRRAVEWENRDRPDVYFSGNAPYAGVSKQDGSRETAGPRG